MPRRLPPRRLPPPRFSARLGPLLAADHRRAEARAGLTREALRSPVPRALAEWLWLDALALHAVGQAMRRRGVANAPAWPAAGPSPAQASPGARLLARRLAARLHRRAAAAPHLHVLGLASVFGGVMIRRSLGAPVTHLPDLAARIRYLSDAEGRLGRAHRAAFLREARHAFRFGAEVLRLLARRG